MRLFEKIRKRRAKRHLNRALKIISKLSWEELDSIIPKPEYKCTFTSGDWSNFKPKYPLKTSVKTSEEGEIYKWRKL